MRSLLRLLVFLLSWHLSVCHVRLSFPPARTPALDYFSTANSVAPCGVAKPPIGQGVRTFLESGSVIDIEWFTAIPHMGGIQLEVLDANDKPIAVFASFTDEYNITHASKTVELPPQFECPNCAIRITHQATEYGNDYNFYSCADINILKAIPDGDSCLNHGQRVSGKCQCEQGYTGSHCQYQDECSSDDDCGVQGKCHKSGEEPRRQCFCPSGRFGDKCSKDSDVIRSASDFDESLYSMREVKDNKIYWRIINDEIEMVLRYPGHSWAAVGWKPKNAVCPSMISTAQSTTATPTILHKVDIQPTLTATHKTTDVFKAAVSNETQDSGEECGPNEEWTECPESSRDCEASCDWTRFPETIPNCPRKCGSPRCICKEGFVRMTNDEETCVPFDFCDKEAEPSCPSNSTWAKCGTACEPSCANMYDSAPCPASCQTAGCTCADNYVRHNGECIYWGDCPDLDSHSHFDEVETVTVNMPAVSAVVTTAPRTSTPSTTRPAPIQSCAVNETINECGKICEADCLSVFTRGECNDCLSPDCACLQGYARTEEGNCVYWGDCPVEGTGLHTRAPTTQAPRTTPKRELKPKVDGDVCYGDFRFPPGCNDCDYKLSWSYMEESDEIEFSLETKLAQNVWSGVGFNGDGSMVGADMLIVKSFNGQLSLHDMTSDGYGAPKNDEQNDIRTPNVIGTHENGVLRAQFMRKRNTGDDVDKQFDGECWRMMYPVTGGQLDASGNITIHSSTPLISDKEVCIRSCNSQTKTSKAAVSCSTGYSYPEGCKGDECEYVAKWQYDSQKKDVRFEISSRNMGRWTGIGFSKDGQMANSDIYTGWVYEGKAYVTDRFAYGRQLPAIDPSDRQDIYDVGGKMENDMQTIWFRRAVRTSDSLTDLPLDQCHHFMFPIGGGRVIAKKSSDFANPRTPIGYHDLYQPRVSPQKICICDANGVSIASEATPTRVRVRRQALAATTSDTLKKSDHAMFCADMVVASVEDGRGRVRDFYSPSKATPRPDSFFGGEDSLTSGSVFQNDGITTVVFRRKLKSNDKYDHSITPGPMTVIWAKGADPDNYQHTTGGAAIRADPKFFAPGVFKYHGKNQRGAVTIDFFDEKKTEPTVHGIHVETSTCTGKYSFPEGCKNNDCSYLMHWMSDGTVARFTIKAALESNQWTALGFSADGSMPNSDVIVLGVQGTQITVTDQFMPNYGRPVVDEQQDIFDVETSYKDGVVTANFSRELFSEDSHDVNLQQCIYLLYTPNAGEMEKNGEMRKHGELPVVSHRKVCLNTCSEVSGKKPVMIEATPTPTIQPTTEESTAAATDSAATTSPAPKKTTKKVLGGKSKETVSMPPLTKKPAPTVVYEPVDPVKARYGLRVRILNKEYIPELADPQTEYYQSFTKKVTTAIDDLLSKRWKGMQVSKIIGYSKGSVIAEFEVVSTNAVARPIELRSLVEENAIRGNIGEFSIEPSTVKAHEIESAPAVLSAAPSMLHNRMIYIIVAASLALLTVITIAICCICKCTSTRRYNSYPVPHPAAYPYGTMGMKQQPAGFDNAAYHQRHYSQATTASTKPGQLTPPSPGENEPAPDGMGETTYQEWYSKVGSKAASQQHEEAMSTPHPAGPSVARPPSAQPYVSYPNDPSGYYTLGGEHRAQSRQEPKYFRY